jgi:hypothetical protein
MMDLFYYGGVEVPRPRIFLVLITTSNRRTHRMSILQNDSVSFTIATSQGTF